MCATTARSDYEAPAFSQLFPLWLKDTHELLDAMLNGGLKARIVCVDPSNLAPEFAGRDLDEVWRDFPASVDPCGENGEFHTFVYDGPMFSRPISIESGETVTRDGFVYADVLPVKGGADALVRQAV